MMIISAYVTDNQGNKWVLNLIDFDKEVYDFNEDKNTFESIGEYRDIERDIMISNYVKTTYNVKKVTIK